MKNKEPLIGMGPEMLVEELEVRESKIEEIMKAITVALPDCEPSRLIIQTGLEMAFQEGLFAGKCHGLEVGKNLGMDALDNIRNRLG